MSYTTNHVFAAQFKKLAHLKSVTATDLILYNIVRGYPLDRGFSPFTNTIKIINGHRSGFMQAKTDLSYLIRYRPDQLVSRYNNIIGKVELNTIINGELK